MKPIIEVNHVWKEYQKGIDRRYKSLRDTLARIPNKVFGAEKEKFWALEDIDFKVEAGESVGIIGKNGAGKSTLLKILSRITPPTKGVIILRGRVASLLEVGTGFHPELTGRENVFFNGSILGMKHAEIKSKFDEIVAFSGVESFIDTPLKHYSSGMQMRLAFSVSAHLDSEILLIDEVLAVGDAEFQKKCIGKMDEVSKGEGKTILFVSHNFNLTSKLCNNSILIDQGLIKKVGPSSKIIFEYLNSFTKKQEISENEIYYDSKRIVKIKSITTIDKNNTHRYQFNSNEIIGIKISYQISENSNIIRYGINIHNIDGINIFDSHYVTSPYYKLIHPNGIFTVISWIPKNILKAGEHFVSFGFFNHQTNSIFARGKYVLSFNIIDYEEDIVDSIPGIINPKLKWEIIKN